MQPFKKISDLHDGLRRPWLASCINCSRIARWTAQVHCIWLLGSDPSIDWNPNSIHVAYCRGSCNPPSPLTPSMGSHRTAIPNLSFNVHISIHDFPLDKPDCAVFIYTMTSQRDIITVETFPHTPQPSWSLIDHRPRLLCIL